jgi:isopentenyl-diphosphate Delta-isomerase
MPKQTPARSTTSRKQEHVELVLAREVGFRRKATGLEGLEFEHNALPEIDLADVDCSTEFLGRRSSFPLLVSSMTGGYPDALLINRRLAEACEEAGIPMGVGSQRQALEDRRFHRTFRVVREVAPSIAVIGNIGAVEVARMPSADGARRLVDLVRADALAVHLNPVQELLQPEGTPAFSGVLKGIERLVRRLPVPIIVKEVGAGLSASVARRLLDAGVRHLDVAGAGGTSWAGVEILRRRDRRHADAFWDWGIPTVRALTAVAALKNRRRPFTLIASGGIQSGYDVARCVALGADMTGAARPLLQALQARGPHGLRRIIDQWRSELRAVMFLTGSRTLEILARSSLVRY